MSAGLGGVLADFKKDQQRKEAAKATAEKVSMPHTTRFGCAAICMFSIHLQQCISSADYSTHVQQCASGASAAESDPLPATSASLHRGWLHFLFLQKALKDGIAKGKRAGKGQEPAKPAPRQSTRDFLTTGRAPIRGSTPLGKQIKVTSCAAGPNIENGKGQQAGHCSAAPACEQGSALSGAVMQHVCSIVHGSCIPDTRGLVTGTLTGLALGLSLLHLS